MESKRKIIQIAFDTYGSGDISDVTVGSTLHALYDDGSIWYLQEGSWQRWGLPEIPQDEPPKGDSEK